LNIIKQIQAIKGGIDILELERTMVQLVDYISATDNAVSWGEGIETINDLIYLKQQNNSKLSEGICSEILNWVEQKYEHSLFEGFQEGEEKEEKEVEQIVKTLNLTIDTLFVLQECINVIPFFKNKLKLAKNDFEFFELKYALESIEDSIGLVVQELNDETLDAVLKRTNQYFLNKVESGVDEKLWCGLRPTIMEHDLSYSIHCCLNVEKYLSSNKRTVSIGSGALFLSKKTELVAFSGSAPGTDWVEWFELEIKNEEIYWLLEIDYKTKKITALKNVLNKNTPELLKLVTKEKTIVLEDELWCLEKLKENFEHVLIDCRIIKRTRKKNNS
jgi:hypothetical protein